IYHRAVHSFPTRRSSDLIWKFSVDVSAQFAEVLVRFWQILAVRVLSLVKVRDCVETKPIYAQSQPEIANFLHGIVHGRVIKVQRSEEHTSELQSLAYLVC